MAFPVITRAISAAKNAVRLGADSPLGSKHENVNVPAPVPEIDMQATLRKFTAGMKRYALVSSRSIPEILNKKMLFVVKKAHDKTPLMERSKLEQELGIIAYRIIRSKKTGLLRRGTFQVRGSRALNIIQGMRYRRGEAPLTQKEAKKEARKMIRSRIRGIGALRYGWYHGSRPFQKAVNSYVKMERSTVKARSMGFPATFGRPNPKAKFAYRLTVNRGGRRVIDSRVSRAAAFAFRDETREMGKEIAKRLSEDWEARRYFK